MPQFDVNAPDGKTFTVNAPEGATHEDAIAYVQKNFYTPVSTAEKLMRGAADPIEGGAQLLTHVLPDGVVNAGNKLNNWLADKTGLVAKIPDGGMDALVAGNEKSYQDKRAAAGESGFDGYRTLGNLVSPANLALMAKTPQAVSLAGKIGYGALAGATNALSTPVTDGDFWGNKGTQVATGAAIGGAMAPVASAAARVISPKASVNPELEMLKREGVKPTVGQTLGGMANSIEEKLQSVPLVGDAISAARQRAREQFNTAAINRATRPIGETVEGAGQTAVAEAGNKISAVYEKAKTMLGGFPIDQQAQAEMSSLAQAAALLPQKERGAFNRIYTNYIKGQPALTAETFKELDSKLGKEAAEFAGSNDAYQKKLGGAFQQLQAIINDNAKRANPQAAALFKQADEAWANLVRVEGASVGAKGTGGVFTPGQLTTAVRGADKSVRDRATARGAALMQDLATAGQNVLGNKVADSGTAGRLMLGGGALASSAVSPGIPLGLLAGAGLYTPAAQNLLRGLVSARPDAAQPIAEALRKSSPYLVPAGAQIGLGLLN